MFGVNFESRDSDHTVVSRAPNNPGLDTSHVSKALTAALEGSFVWNWQLFQTEIFEEVGLASNGARGGPVFESLTPRGRVKACEDCRERAETRN